MIETGDAAISLRRWSHEAGGEDHFYGYHNASIDIDRQPIQRRENGIQESLPLPEPTDPRWPIKCEHCDYEFTAEDSYQINQTALYVPAPGNEGAGPLPHEWGEHVLPVGAMYYMYWKQRDGCQPWRYCPTDNSVLTVVIPDNPDGTGRMEWDVDAYCSNCSRNKSEDPHHCWCRSGVAPWITVSKTPPSCDNLGTCAEGAGSIWTRMPTGWHGYLRNGWLMDA